MRAEGPNHYARASAAPEVLLNKKDIDNRKADCWSIGVILYQVEPQLVVLGSPVPQQHLSLHTPASTSLQTICSPVQLLFGEHPFEKSADVEEGSVKRTLHRILKVVGPWHLPDLTYPTAMPLTGYLNSLIPQLPGLHAQVDYKLPAHASLVSPEAMDLLQHILVEDPTKRYCLQDMQNHPW